MKQLDSTRIAKALIRLLWDSVADRAECTCYPKDRCPQCEATLALGLGRWTGARLMQVKIAKLSTRLESSLP